LHPAVAEVAVAGLPDQRWVQRITTFIKRCGAIEADALDAWCRGSSLADYNARASTCLSPKSRNRRSARSCAACSSHRRE
jgi:acyl-CoA synthetase (AMP-forming)/AMP-acid ligase II